MGEDYRRRRRVWPMKATRARRHGDECAHTARVVLDARAAGDRAGRRRKRPQHQVFSGDHRARSPAHDLQHPGLMGFARESAMSNAGASLATMIEQRRDHAPGRRGIALLMVPILLLGMQPPAEAAIPRTSGLRRRSCRRVPGVPDRVARLGRRRKGHLPSRSGGDPAAQDVRGAVLPPWPDTSWRSRISRCWPRPGSQAASTSILPSCMKRRRRFLCQKSLARTTGHSLAAYEEPRLERSRMRPLPVR